MRLNEHTALVGDKIILVPYRREHVQTYHEWMSRPELLALTASEPLSLDEEYDMQRKWRDDADKLTFIILARVGDTALTARDITALPMVGDVNVFFAQEDEAELEIMIAENAYRRQGLARSALQMLLSYITDPPLAVPLSSLVAKIGKDNAPSIALFRALGFELATQPNVFDEMINKAPVPALVQSFKVDLLIIPRGPASRAPVNPSFSLIPIMPSVEVVIPTLDVLGVKDGFDQIDAKAIASEWLNNFALAVNAANIDGLLELFVEDSFWRDFLALTWEMRTFYGKGRIGIFLKDRLVASEVTNVKLSVSAGEEPVILKPYPDLVWLQVSFTFETATGLASAIARLIPNAKDTIWRAHTLFTNLEGLKGFPPTIGPLRDSTHFSGTWTSKREAERDFANAEPAVLIVGAGQAGMEIAARLRYLGVPTLLVDRNERIGDQWRGRYESLCLHDPVWYDHMPYIPFPPGWPVWTPAPKLADWLESYAKSMDLNVWLSSAVSHTEWDATAKHWNVTVSRNGQERVLHPRHFIVAVGLGGGVPFVPEIPGQDKYQGLAIHSTSFKSGRSFIGKKVLVVGACTSAHDISAELHSYGVDVTMYQRSSTYIMSTDNGFPIVHKDLFVEGGPAPDRGDRLFASYPNHLLRLLHQRATQEIKVLDAETLGALERVGFQLNDGPDGSGFWMNALERGGGYYLDVGTSALIAAGKIKLVSGPQLTELTATGAAFSDGRAVDADVVIYATGFGDFKDALRQMFSEEIVQQTKTFWGLDDEGEVQGVWREAGHPGLYVMMGNLQMCRFHSNHVALQIKAREEGVPVEPYVI